MKHKTLNLEEKKLQLKKTTIEIFDLNPRHLRMVIGRGKVNEQTPLTTQQETQGKTSP